MNYSPSFPPACALRMLYSPSLVHHEQGHSFAYTLGNYLLETLQKRDKKIYKIDKREWTKVPPVVG